jgi:phenylalanyl-tRNA synthetase beta subunit
MRIQMDYLWKLYLFEFSLKHIQDQIQEGELPIFQEYSLYPRIIKDLSFIIPKDITFTGT